MLRRLFSAFRSTIKSPYHHSKTEFENLRLPPLSVNRWGVESKPVANTAALPQPTADEVNLLQKIRDNSREVWDTHGTLETFHAVRRAKFALNCVYKIPTHGDIIVPHRENAQITSVMAEFNPTLANTDWIHYAYTLSLMLGAILDDVFDRLAKDVGYSKRLGYPLTWEELIRELEYESHVWLRYELRASAQQYQERRFKLDQAARAYYNRDRFKTPYHYTLLETLTFQGLSPTHWSSLQGFKFRRNKYAHPPVKPDEYSQVISGYIKSRKCVGREKDALEAVAILYGS